MPTGIFANQNICQPECDVKGYTIQEFPRNFSALPAKGELQLKTGGWRFRRRTGRDAEEALRDD